MVAEHERYMERAVPYKSLRYIRELAEAGKPKEIRAVRLQCGRVTGNKKEVLEEVAQSSRRQHSQGQQELSGITREMVRALPRVFTAEQSEDIHRSRVTLGEINEAAKALKGTKSPGVDQLVAEAYQHLEAPELDGLAGRVKEGVAHRRAPKEMGGQGAAPVQEAGSPQAGELETNMLCRHRGQAGLDGDLREDTAAAVCSGGHTGQYVGVSAG